MKQVKSIFIAILILFIAVLGMPLDSDAKVPDRKVINYVALGDSLAAGYTPVEFGDSGFKLEKIKGYPEYLKDRFQKSNYKVTLNNHSVPGATTIDLVDKLKEEEVINNIAKADVITIDIGANDLLEHLYTNDRSRLYEASGEALENIEDILGIIKESTDAKIYVMGYYNALWSLPIEEGTKEELVSFLHQFNHGIKQITETNQAIFVPTFQAIAEDYETYLPYPDIHLSQEGYQAVAKEFWKKMTPRKFGN
ncbi:SGNH/GDSL hydrolase family protein [Thalassobacillus devorans]|uniref:SGNH/GDSL hydrolase family protein n=1 Tax=Thalassobacillus devorans TaxID=279813 RepID=UPI000A1CEC39|nr:GDSL-type esterase/lipase family protein [Thalassobacillus devorans]